MKPPRASARSAIREKVQSGGSTRGFEKPRRGSLNLKVKPRLTAREGIFLVRIADCRGKTLTSRAKPAESTRSWALRGDSVAKFVRSTACEICEVIKGQAMQNLLGDESNVLKDTCQVCDQQPPHSTGYAGDSLLERLRSLGGNFF